MKQIYTSTLSQCMDVELKPNIRRTILAVVVMLSGIAFYLITKQIHTNNQQFAHFFIAFSAIVTAYGFHLLMSNQSQLVYEPTNSRLKHYTLCISKENSSLISIFCDCETDLKAEIDALNTSEGTFKMECLISNDHKLVVLQLSNFSGLCYRTCTPLHIYHDEKANEIAEIISDARKERES